MTDYARVPELIMFPIENRTQIHFSQQIIIKSTAALIYIFYERMEQEKKIQEFGRVNVNVEQPDLFLVINRFFVFP